MEPTESTSHIRQMTHSITFTAQFVAIKRNYKEFHLLLKIISWSVTTLSIIIFYWRLHLDFFWGRRGDEGWSTMTLYLGMMSPSYATIVSIISRTSSWTSSHGEKYPSVTKILHRPHWISMWSRRYLILSLSNASSTISRNLSIIHQFFLISFNFFEKLQIWKVKSFEIVKKWFN